MEEALKAILIKAKASAKKVNHLADWQSLKSEFLGRKGVLSDFMEQFKTADKATKAHLGHPLNEVKRNLEQLFSQLKESLEERTLQAQLGEEMDVTLPPTEPSHGVEHPLSQLENKIKAIFYRAGFQEESGPEIEREAYCFDYLNTPKEHPARDEQDTFYFSSERDFCDLQKANGEKALLRTHTSSVQIRVLLEQKPPLRMLSSGRVFRRDTLDATHSPHFHQIEGLYVDRKVSLTDLNELLNYFVKALFGDRVETRLRPSHFPFTEPSFEMDVKSQHLGKLSDQWIEILGCGWVDPNVLEAVDIDPNQWSGYAFGLGLERIAMLLLGIDDIRHFYQNDLRFLKQWENIFPKN